MNKSVYNYIDAIFLSFFSNDLYVDVAKRWRGIGIFYLVFVCAIVTIPLSMVSMGKFNQIFEEQFVNPLRQLPTIILHNGVVNVDKPMPYLITNSNNETVSAVDTTNKITMNDPQYSKLIWLVTKNEIFFRAPSLDLINWNTPPQNRQVYSYAFSDTDNGVFQSAVWIQDGAVSTLKKISIASIYPTILISVATIILIVVLIFALLGQLLSRIFFSFSIPYTAACRLMAVAMTPALFFYFLFQLFQWNNVGLYLVFTAIFSLYFFYGILSVKRESRQVAQL